MLLKSTIREITKSLGRYFAIIAIVALGVGFFAGLVQSRDVMVTTVDGLLNKQNMHDFEMISTLGFTGKDINKIEDSLSKGNNKIPLDKVEGFKSKDFVYMDNEDVERVIKAISMPKNHVDMPKLSEGRMPTKSSECVADNSIFDSNDIGKTIKIKNSDKSLIKKAENTFKGRASSDFKVNSFKIVGLVSSPIFLNQEKGYSNLGNGTVYSYVYVPGKAFDFKYFTSVALTIKNRPKIYTKEYEDAIEDSRDKVSDVLTKVSNDRYDRLVSDAKKQANAKFKKVGLAKAPDFVIKEAVSKIQKPTTYLFDRNHNAGYATFESDSNIVRGIANVFPAFFFLVAALVVMTSMARLVDEQRTEIGVLKALGYKDSVILGKYLFYAVSATFIGAVLGYLGGSYVFPTTIWDAYQSFYHFDTPINYPHNVALGIATLAVCIAGSAGATFLAFHEDRKGMPASLIIPKSPKEGKRILLEKIPFIWQKFSFLYKVTFRNIFRYKKRLFMMLLGIGGCTALLLTGFGINDSIKNIASYQYEEISVYDYKINFSKDMKGSESDFLKDNKTIDKSMFYHDETLKYKGKKDTIDLKLIASDEKNIKDFVNLEMSGKSLEIPSNGKIIICEKLADEQGVKVGSKINLKNEAGKSAEFEVAAVTRNFIDNYIYMNTATYKNHFGKSASMNEALVNVKGLDRPVAHNDKSSIDKIFDSSVGVLQDENVRGTIINHDNYTRITNMMDSLNSVIAVIVLAAAGLALIVLYNLSNISITERVREIATIKVLGFYPKETALYIFRESTFLTAFGALIGVALGRLLHAFVMHQIQVEMVYFQLRISWFSYVIAFALTMVFAGIVNFIMYFKIKNIDMIDSLKVMD